MVQSLPFEVFVLFIGLAMTIGIIGIIMGLRKIDGAPFITIFAGILLFGEFALTSGLIMGYDNSNTSSSTPYNVQSNTGQIQLFTGSSIATGERLSNSSSELVGKDIDCITVWIGRTGVPPANVLFTIGVMDSTTQYVTQFGSMNITALISSASTPYQFCLPIGQTHTLQSTEVVGFKWNSGNATNSITSRIDNNNPFDSNNTERVQSTTGTSWTANSGQDMMMIMSLRGSDPQPIEYQFNNDDNWIFMIMLSAIFIFIGVIFQWKKA